MSCLMGLIKVNIIIINDASFESPFTMVCGIHVFDEHFCKKENFLLFLFGKNCNSICFNFLKRGL